MRADMNKNKKPYPIVDVFAGPGGLGEGFASLLNENEMPRFHSVASIESDKHSHKTLLLRHFYRRFPHGEALMTITIILPVRLKLKNSSADTRSS